MIVDERIAPIVGRQVTRYDSFKPLLSKCKSPGTGRSKKKNYHFNGVQSNREAIDVQPWNAASRLKTGFCRVYVYWPVFGFNQTRS